MVQFLVFWGVLGAGVREICGRRALLSVIL